MSQVVVKFRGWKCPASAQRAFTLLELMMSATVVGLLFTVGVPTYRGIVERQAVQQCVRDLVTIAGELEKYRTLHFEWPDSLDELSGVPRTDPWGFEYRFLNFESDIKGIKGKIRKDHNLHPLNSEFDLYSVGPDGRSSAPLTAKASRDDVIYARDGSFIGIAEDF
jgi:general secretion pathway protein G